MSQDSSKLTRQERRSAIVGMLLGDASLYRNRFADGSYRGLPLLKVTHSIKQVAYLEWKREIVQPMFGYPLVIVNRENSAQNGKRYPVAVLQTRTNPQFTRLYRMMYPEPLRKKRVTRTILDMLDDRGMACWYLDDGCLSQTVGRGATVILATNSYTLEENELIRDWIAEQYGVTFNINVHQKTGTHNLRRGVSDACKMLDAIAPYVIPSMRYKVEYPQPKRGAWYKLQSTVPGPESAQAEG